MTILPDPLSQAATEHAAALARAAEAAAAVLPAVSPLTPTAPQPGNLGSAMEFAGAAIASFEGVVSGSVAVLVGPDLVAALESSPLGALDLAAASQPAVDAAARELGAQVGAARTVPIDLVVNDMGGMFTVVPLVGAGGSAALLVSDVALVEAARAAAQPAAAAAPQPGQPQPAPMGTFQAAPSAPAVVTPMGRGLEMLSGVIMDVTVELGRTRMSVRELLALTPGTVLELDRAAGSPADLLVNGRLIARGEVVVVDEDFGLRVTEIVDQAAAS
jgi:flagellar motor switch protein FliN/FliY